MESNGLALQIHVSPKTKEYLDEYDTFDLEQREEKVFLKGLGHWTTWWLKGENGGSDEENSLDSDEEDIIEEDEDEEIIQKYQKFTKLRRDSLDVQKTLAKGRRTAFNLYQGVTDADKTWLKVPPQQGEAMFSKARSLEKLNQMEMTGSMQSLASRSSTKRVKFVDESSR